MLLEFSIKNFLSFKDKVTLSMVGGATKGLKENHVMINEKKILKSLAIYGPNASGKTNLFKILTMVIYMINNSNNMKINDKLPIEPFKFDKKSENGPSEFEIRFLTKGIKYVYGFVADKNKIYDEYLYYYPNGRESKIFDRTKINEYSFTQSDERELKDIAKKNATNKFFLATATAWNYEKTKNAFLFITSSISSLNSLSELRDISLRMHLKQNDELKPFALTLLKEADFNIEDYNVIETVLPDDVLQSVPKFLRNEMVHAKSFNAKFKHIGSDKEISLNDESMGTQIIFYFIPFLLDTINKGKILVVDELDRSLHPYLVEMITNLFNNKSLNKNNAQLIFNTYDTHLLNSNSLRRDQIWFTEKDNETGSSDLFSLSDFSVRNDENFEKGYMLGRYGAVPYIKNDINLWEEK